MKKYMLLIMVFVLIISACSAQNKTNTPAHNDATWLTNLEEAQAKAAAEKKFVLVNFSGSDWCGWCIKLDEEVFSQEAFLNYAEKNLILVNLDFPQSTPQDPAQKTYNKSIAEKYKIAAFPSVYVFDYKGELVYKAGYVAGGAQNYVDVLKTELKVIAAPKKSECSR